MPARLIESLATTEEMAAVFSDDSLLQAMLDFESALARAEARVGVIPESAAAAITKAAVASNFDSAEIARQTLRAGTPGIPLVKALTERVRISDAASAGYVHWGTTSQDVADTAMILLLRRCGDILAADQGRIDAALRDLSDKHADTVMLGRTLLQPAPPITFGLKAAQWRAAICRGWKRVSQRLDTAMVLEFGGASGTLAALGPQGLAVSQALAAELHLREPAAPWHAYPDDLAALMAALGIYAGSLGKMALDISLLMQAEVAEVAEPGGEGRGGSSTMPHKRNPTASAIAIAAARRVPHEVAAFMSCLLQEHQRAAGGWQAEWAIIATVMQLAAVALASMREVAEGTRRLPSTHEAEH